MIAVQGFQFKGSSYSHHAIISRCFRDLVTRTLHSIERGSQLGLTRDTVQQGHLLSPGILICCCLTGRTQTLLGCSHWRTCLETSALDSPATGMDETNCTANTCIYTAPPVGQWMSCELMEVGWIETYSLSSFLFLLPSKQDERGHSWAKCSFQWRATFLLL